jgi:hypothetical protein
VQSLRHPLTGQLFALFSDGVSEAADGSVGGAVSLDAGTAALYGPAFLDFVLNGVAPAEVHADDAPRREVLAALQAIGSRALTVADPHGRRLELIRMLRQPGDGGVPLAHQMRGVSGGTMPHLSSDDEVGQSLAELALVAFPFQLLEVTPGDPFLSGADTMATFGHEARENFDRIVYEDSVLRMLFPDPVGSPGGEEMGEVLPSSPSGNLIWSTGGSGGLALNMVATSALDFMFTQMRVADEFDLFSVSVHAQATVDVMRKLASRRRAQVPLVVSLANLSVAPGVVASLGAGRLMSAESIRGRVRSVDQHTTAVVVLSTELRLLDILPTDLSANDSDPVNSAFGKRFDHRLATMRASDQALDREVTRARLAIALASSDEMLLAPTFRARSVINPLSGGSGSWAFNPFSTSLAPAAQVDASFAESIADWGYRVAAHPDSMWMGARRLLSAMADRGDSLDAFIDAVVCWENLLGSETEVTFRVSAGLSALLEADDSSRRLELFDELKDLYKIRSGLIHGSKEPPAAESHDHAQRAIRVAIDATRAIYHRPELLDAPSSGVRNRRLLLGV